MQAKPKWSNRPESYQKQAREYALSQGRNSLKTNRTNREFAETNKAFQCACTVAEIPPTTRQANKYRRKLGLAYTMEKRNG